MDAEQEFKDKWDNMVSIPCPRGGHLARRLPIQMVEGETELIGVECQHPGCGQRFNWEERKEK